MPGRRVARPEKAISSRLRKLITASTIHPLLGGPWGLGRRCLAPAAFCATGVSRAPALPLLLIFAGYSLRGDYSCLRLGAADHKRVLREVAVTRAQYA